jgi:glutamate-ammonia-ligase adenylyltransferase
MKELIEMEVRRRQISQNIKLGKGGIREVEFFVQSLQLIHAGRHTKCQITSILLSMQALEAQHLTSTVNISQLREDYLLLRQIEHYLQAFNDEQTQTLPNNAKDQFRLATLLGHNNYEQTIQCVEHAMARIHEVFKHIIEDQNDASVGDKQADNQATNQSDIAHALDDIWQLSLDKAEAVTALDECLSLDASELLVDLILKFKKKAERTGVSPRALKSINKLMPLLLCEMVDIEGKWHDEVFADQTEGVFSILQTISGRVTYIDLLLEHPVVRERLLHLCKKSPWVASQIAQYPILLDELLHPLYLDKNELSLSAWKNQCADHLRQTLLRVDIKDEEQVMDLLREFKHTTQLRIAAADISGTLAINQVSDKLTILAEVIMQQVIDIAWQQIAVLYGQPGIAEQSENLENIDLLPTMNQLALVAYGKFGGLELSYGSDLDIVFLHNADLSLSTDTTGTRKQLSNQEFYIKLVQRICHICTTKTYNGMLYEIDLRLRPSGNSGLLVSHIDTFLSYQETNAWTWEHQALVRSRVIVGSPELSERFNELRHEILSMPRDTAKLKQDVFEMREKMRVHLEKKHLNQIDIKQTSGGIVDLEFMVQFWILAHANKHPLITKWSDNLRLLEGLARAEIIDTQQQKLLCRNYLALRHAAHRIQLANRQFARGGKNKSTKLAKAIQDVESGYQSLFKEVLQNQ